MAEKMTWIELRRKVGARAGANQKETAAFMDELLKQIVAGLKTDKVVRITGLGAFKLQEVAPRKSVNVVTGEDIVLAGYEKVVFVPEAGIKELVATAGTPVETASPAETADINPLQKLGEQADEIAGLLADLGQPVGAEPSATPEQKPVEVPVEMPAAAPQIPVETPQAPIDTPPAPIEKPQVPVAPVTPAPEPVKQPEPVKYHFLRDTLITLIILLLLLAGAFFYFRHEMTNWVESLRTKQQTPVEVLVPDTVAVIEEEPADTVALSDTTVIKEPEPIAEEAIQQEEQPKQAVEEQKPQKAVEEEPYTPKSLTIRKGDGLMQIARRYYGHPDFWVFIYEANESKFKSPDNICWGTRIQMPQLTKEERDITNPQTRKRIRELTQKYSNR